MTATNSTSGCFIGTPSAERLLRWSTLAVAATLLGCSTPAGDVQGAAVVPQTPITEIVLGGQTASVSESGDASCESLKTTAGNLAPLAFGLNGAGQVVGLRLIRGDEDCTISRETTARALVMLAVGAELVPADWRAQAWAGSSGADLAGIVEVLASAPDLEAVLDDPTRSANLVARVQTTADGLVLPWNLMEAAKIVTADPLSGLDGLEFSSLSVSADGKTLSLAVKAPESAVHEIKAIMVADHADAFVKGADVLDPLQQLIFQPTAEASTTIAIPAGQIDPGSMSFPLHVVAPAVFTRLALWKAQRPLTLNEELAYGDVARRTLAGYAANALLTIFPDLSKAWAGKGCAEKFYELLSGLAADVTKKLEAGQPPGAAVEDMMSTMWTKGIEAYSACGGGASSKWSAKLAKLLGNALGYWSLFQQTKHLLTDVGGGPALAVHTVHACAACGGAACSLGAGKLVCGATCSDMKQNQGETGVDCGGPCPPCMACGDGVAQPPEECDGGDLQGKTCKSLAFDAGVLQCNGDCTFNPKGCCKNECSSGAKQCLDANTLQTCGDYDVDQCVEWGGNSTCAFGCQNGACKGVPQETCNGLDDDMNGLVDDLGSCWQAIYRYQSPSGARCWSKDPNMPPPKCAGYSYEIEAFILRTNQVANTFEVRQCSKMTDHILVPFASADYNALVAAAYDCSLSLGYMYDVGAAPPSGKTQWKNTCPLYRFNFPASSTHIFSRGAENLNGLVCEPPARGDVFTNATCFAMKPSGC